MTQIQVDYQKAEEAKRHNAAMEELEAHDVASRRLSALAAQKQAEASKKQADTAARKLTSDAYARMSDQFRTFGTTIQNQAEQGGTLVMKGLSTIFKALFS